MAAANMLQYPVDPAITTSKKEFFDPQDLPVTYANISPT